MTTSNFWVFPSKAGKMYWVLFANCRLLLRPQVGEVPETPIRTWEGTYSTLAAWPMLPRAILSTPVQLNCRGVLLSHTPPDAASATIYFIVGIKSVCGATTTGAILWSILSCIVRTTTGMVWLLNFFGSKINVASMSNFFIPVSSVSNCFQIARRITLYVTRSHYVWFIIFGVVDCKILHCVC